MDQLAQLPLPHLGRAVAEDEEESVDGVGLAGTIGADDRGEGLRFVGQSRDLRRRRKLERTLWKGPMTPRPR